VTRGRAVPTRTRGKSSRTLYGLGGDAVHAGELGAERRRFWHPPLVQRRKSI
jgi:hypothetical protein